jgi:hypothetical protein
MVADARVERALARVKALCVPVSPIGNIKAPQFPAGLFLFLICRKQSRRKKSNHSRKGNYP